MAQIVTSRAAMTATDDGCAVPTRYGPGTAVRSRVYVRLTDAEGRTGDGEASPLPHFTGETPATIHAALETLLPLVIGCDALALDDLTDHLARHPHQYAAKCAIDAAAHDLAAKTLGVPLALLLGGSLGRPVATTGLIGIVDADAAVTAARGYVADGIRTLKMKVGREIAADAVRVGAVREAVGSGVAIRLDGNAGLALPDALALVRVTRVFGIELFEQPARADDLHGLRTVREAGIRVLVDESVHSVRDAIRVLEASACDLIAIKLIKCGGLRPARTIAQVAAAYGVGCILISPYETAVGLATTAHAAIAFGTRDHAHDIFRVPVPAGGAWGHTAVPGGLMLAALPGHGATVGRATADRLEEVSAAEMVNHSGQTVTASA